MKKVLSIIITVLMVCAAYFSAQPMKVSAAPKNVIVVIDPGHGGTGERNLGAQYGSFSEKDMTLKLGNALKAELEKYDGITVYTTRTTDTVISLEDRAAYAKSVGADFVFSLHFNASSDHEFYGSEVWTSAFGDYYVAGANFGRLVTAEWNGLGLYQKGVKTRLGASGADYYGIIRQSVARNMPCAILEHAYLDHGYDTALLSGSDFINKLAVADATAIAKYFGLSSSKTGADFSNFSYTSVKKPALVPRQDETAPETCSIKVLGYDKTNGNILVEMTTRDSQSPVIYFSYSYDGGKTYSLLQMWDRTKDTQSFNVKVPSGSVNPTIVCRAYNSYEKCAQSIEVPVAEVFRY
ncbi:N-acetylmuramoyl-L-alanine amidase family protein [Butyrivibrio sp. AE3009]|uniref:N-acetylmuramoyl-L-alanine amidase family protein n=1 Tax=Butyrivibrio sp. AE3009 TaxID=1280666 RepID=UPI0003B4DE63|nr:N-acetylmuramoyl-L-alanine amidase [Butyrivibrio sp. AE3009]